jgi:uncharacterized membrane protein YidH (DUF202 family)
LTSPTLFDELEEAAESDISLHLALERTRMASERTLFSLVRTGFAIAGGGVLIIKILAAGAWASWLTMLLSMIFITVGFALIFIALHRYHQVAGKIKKHDGINPIPSRLITALIILLQLALVAVVVIYLLE